jgi:hypothetical protein
MAITNYSVGTGTGTAAYNNTTGAEVAVTVIYITNTTTSDGNVDVYVVPSGDSVGAQHKIYNNLLIRSKDTYIIDSEKLILENGAKIFIASPDSSAQFNATISTIGI